MLCVYGLALSLYALQCEDIKNVVNNGWALAISVWCTLDFLFACVINFVAGPVWQNDHIRVEWDASGRMPRRTCGDCCARYLYQRHFTRYTRAFVCIAVISHVLSMPPFDERVLVRMTASDFATSLLYAFVHMYTRIPAQLPLCTHTSE
jgi:hypothetical protein